VRFEHCYRIDEERQVAIAEKVQCWRDWSRRYRHGQSRDRIEYALGRERTLSEALARGQSAAPSGGAIGASARPLPQPINPYAPPLQTMTPASATAAIASSSAPTETPGATCTEGCGKAFNTCKQQCKDGTCRTGCDDHYRHCMRACF
jgi:hypothetical protein